jgi:hydrogenase maturation protease
MTARGAILGVGNILQRDDGIGIKTLKYLESRYQFPSVVELVDGGTTGAGLDRSIVDKEWLIVIDALDVPGTPGEVKYLAGEEFINRPATTKMSPHQVGFLDLLQVMKLEGTGPDELHFIGVIPESVSDGLEISSSVERSMGELIQRLLNLLKEKEIVPIKREPALKPDYWWLPA